MPSLWSRTGRPQSSRFSFFSGFAVHVCVSGRVLRSAGWRNQAIKALPHSLRPGSSELRPTGRAAARGPGIAVAKYRYVAPPPPPRSAPVLEDHTWELESRDFAPIRPCPAPEHVRRRFVLRILTTESQQQPAAGVTSSILRHARTLASLLVSPGIRTSQPAPHSLPPPPGGTRAATASGVGALAKPRERPLR